MKNALSVALLTLGVMAVFGLGFTASRTGHVGSQVEQVHLSCWTEQGETSLERIRLVLNKSLHGLVWLSRFNGDPAGEGTLEPGQGEPQASSIKINVTTTDHRYTAEIPNSVFQPHIKSLRMQVGEGDASSSLECRKLNLRKRQSNFAAL